MVKSSQNSQRFKKSQKPSLNLLFIWLVCVSVHTHTNTHTDIMVFWRVRRFTYCWVPALKDSLTPVGLIRHLWAGTEEAVPRRDDNGASSERGGLICHLWAGMEEAVPRQDGNGASSERGGAARSPSCAGCGHSRTPANAPEATRRVHHTSAPARMVTLTLPTSELIAGSNITACVKVPGRLHLAPY